MKHTLRLLVLSLTLAFTTQLSFAQLDGSEPAPGWELTDINGTTWNLYDILNEGKTVFLDFSATWCGPCWSYHQGHEMRDLYDQYGPNGTDEVMVFMIEGDPNTDAQDLNGLTGSTQGDWVTGTTYPIIDDGSITNLYSIGYWPTIYAICPSRRIAEVGQVGVQQFLNFKDNCPGPEAGLDLSALSVLGLPNSLCDQDEQTTARVSIFNPATEVLTSAKVELTANGGHYVLATENWTGSLASHKSFDIDMSVTIPYWASDLGVRVSEVNGGATETSTDNNVFVDDFIGAVAPETYLLRVEVKADNFANQISWAIYNSGGSLQEADQLQASDNGATVTQDFTLGVFDCYEFTVLDSDGDGISAGGYVKLLTQDDEEILTVNGDDYSAVAVRNIRIGHNVTAVDEIIASDDLTVYPNPFSEITNVSYNLGEASNVRMNVLNTLGQVVYAQNFGTLPAGEQRFDFDGSDLEAGMYLINITVGEQVITKRVSLTK